MGANPQGFGETTVVVRPFDEEQQQLVGILRAAGGSPVSFEQLRAQGIENPATLAYELEIAGLPITHVRRSSVGGPTIHTGIQLGPGLEAPDADSGSAPTGRGIAAVLAGVGASGRGEGRREQPELASGVLIGLAVLAVLAAAVVLAGSLRGSGASHGTRHIGAAAARSAQRTQARSSALHAGAVRRTARRPAHETPAPSTAAPSTTASVLTSAAAVSPGRQRRQGSGRRAPGGAHRTPTSQGQRGARGPGGSSHSRSTSGGGTRAGQPAHGHGHGPEAGRNGSSHGGGSQQVGPAGGLQAPG